MAHYVLVMQTSMGQHFPMEETNELAVTVEPIMDHLEGNNCMILQMHRLEHPTQATSTNLGDDTVIADYCPCCQRTHIENLTVVTLFGCYPENLKLFPIRLQSANFCFVI